MNLASLLFYVLYINFNVLFYKLHNIDCFYNLESSKNIENEILANFNIS